MFYVDVMCMFCNSPEVTLCGGRGYQPSINKQTCLVFRHPHAGGGAGAQHQPGAVGAGSRGPAGGGGGGDGHPEGHPHVRPHDSQQGRESQTHPLWQRGPGWWCGSLL